MDVPKPLTTAPLPSISGTASVSNITTNESTFDPPEPLIKSWFCLIAFGGPTLGYHLGISGGVTTMTPFLNKFFPDVKRNYEASTTSQYCKYDSQKLQAFTSSLYLSAFIASFFASWVRRKLGYPKMMLMVGFIISLGSVVTAFAVNIAMLIGGRFIIGIAIGFAMQSMPLYMSEMSPYKYRRHINIRFQMTITFGILQAHVFNNCMAIASQAWGWRVSLGLGVNPLLILLSFFLLDTPSSLLERGKKEEAKALLKRICGINVNVETEFNNMVAAMKEARLVENPWNTNLVKNKCYRPQLVMSILIPLFQHFTGISVTLIYAPVIFKTIAFQHNLTSFIFPIITGFVYLLAIASSIYHTDRWEGTSLHLEGVIHMVLLHAVVTVLTRRWRHVPTDDVTLWFAEAVTTICVCMTMITWSWGPLGWSCPIEVFPLEVRRAAQRITVTVNMLAAFIMSQFFLTVFCPMELRIFVLFAFFFVIMTIYCNVFVPEMNLYARKMTRAWGEHWFRRRHMNDLNDRSGNSTNKFGKQKVN